MKLVRRIIIILIFLPALPFAQPLEDMPPEKHNLCKAGQYCFVDERCIFTQAWDTLSQVRFWRKVINMSSDSGILSIGSSREILSIWAQSDWDKFTEEEKLVCRDSIKCARNCCETERVYFTNGKKEFYDFNGAIPLIDRGTQLFVKEATDPFYAQAILLIESPGRIGRSPVGAVGSFQLMKSVGKTMGLTITNTIDERKNFERAAWASAKLIRTVCIPHAQAILQRHNISYNPTDLWFRLLVLHIYHAGAYNVGKAIDAICPSQGGIDLIVKLWNTKAGGFGNASQNYSQIALATMVELSSIMQQEQIFTEAK
jgi:hypothetical protein